MTTSRLTQIAIRTTALGTLLAGFASVAVAQKAKHGGGPPLTTQGTIKSDRHADKGQDKAESKREDARDDKAERSKDNDDDRGERAESKSGRSQSKALLKGIELTSQERKSMKEIEKRYADERKDLRKQAHAADKAGHPDATIAAKMDALRMRERGELRAGLTSAQQLQYDRNVTALGNRKP